MNIFQSFLTEDKLKEVCTTLRYADTSRKFIVYLLLQFFVAASVGEWKEFRHGAECTSDFKLETVHYSTISTKATEVSFEISKKFLHILVKKCNS